jgi:phosphopantothenoylcysteine decarboxylase/phosphopantothenate--cysteine ligase
LKILITTGPTREALDPVRYLSNRSSGKMGFALAKAAQAAGHQVILVTGPVCLTQPEGVSLHRVVSAQEMWEKVQALTLAESPEIAIHAAAVADYRPKAVQDQKIKKHSESLTLELERTPDVLGSMRSIFGFKGYLVGFAAETENLIAYAQGKLERKDCNLIVANDVSRSEIGFDSDENEVVLCFRSGKVEHLPKQTKETLAQEILHRILVESASSQA